MATSLMSRPCGDDCNIEGEFVVSFVATSLVMSDKESAQLFKDVLLLVTWDGNVVKLQNDQEGAEEFNESMKLMIHSTPEHLSRWLKTCPIMLDLSRGCTELGTIKLEISDCFADAVLCAEFNSQTVTVDLKFSKDGQDNADMAAYFRIQKLLDDGISGNLFKEFNSKSAEHSKKLKKMNKKLTEGDEGDCDEDSEKEPCDDFACADDLPEHCKRDLGLNQNVYRIINGNLFNMKDQVGPCGEVCPVAGKYIKQLCKPEAENLPLSSRFNFDCTQECDKLFNDTPCGCKREAKVKCPDCGGRLPDRALSACKEATPMRQSCKDDWIDRNIQEEDLLKKLCQKYGVNVDEIRAAGGPAEEVQCKKTKKKKVKKVKKAKKVKNSQCQASPCDGPFSPVMQPTREKFVKEIKRKCCGKYSFEFGDNYPVHRSCSKVEQGAGDAPTVPKNMGWRWDVPMFDRKWYPGHINRTVRCLMKHAMNPFPYDTIPLTRRDEKGRVMKICSSPVRATDCLVQKPTLRIQKRDGEYFITMNPLKDRAKLETDCNPYLDCTPLQFKIRDHPENIKINRAVKLLRERGLEKKCSCVNLTCCRCMSELQKKLLAYEMKRVSLQFKMENMLTFADLNRDSDSEVDLEFTTPSALVNVQKCKPDVVHCGTQFSEKPTKKPREEQVKTKAKNPVKISKSPTRKVECILIDPPCRPVCAPICAPACASKCVAFRC